MLFLICAPCLCPAFSASLNLLSDRHFEPQQQISSPRRIRLPLTFPCLLGNPYTHRRFERPHRWPCGSAHGAFRGTQFRVWSPSGGVEAARPLLAISQAVLETYSGRARNFICWRRSPGGHSACALVPGRLALLWLQVLGNPCAFDSCPESPSAPPPTWVHQEPPCRDEARAGGKALRPPSSFQSLPDPPTCHTGSRSSRHFSVGRSPLK